MRGTEIPMEKEKEKREFDQATILHYAQWFPQQVSLVNDSPHEQHKP
jgi:hypothetical protein